MGIGSTSSSEAAVAPTACLAPLLGSEGAEVRCIGPDSYAVCLASSRGLPACPNMLQLEVNGYADRELTLDVTFAYPEPRGFFDEYHHSATPDFQSFVPLEWNADRNGRRNALRIPPTGWDTFYVGMQYPLPLEPLHALLAQWAAHPDVTLEEIGRSCEGRPLHRLTIAAAGPVAREERPVHIIANFHPGEGNARWRMVGMVNELLQPTAAASRAGHVFEFFFLLSPDGPANGWRRVQADGIDMNRCFLPGGPDAKAQPPEAFAFQSWLEDRIKSTPSIKTLWCMHTWPGPVEPIFDGLGPEFQTDGCTFDRLVNLFKQLDAAGRMRLPVQRPEPGNPSTWNGGAFRRHGITSVLVEGGGDQVSLQEHLRAGADLARIISTFWSESRPHHA